MKTIQYCPPAAAYAIESPSPIFADRKQFPVHLPDTDEDGNFERAISFDDFSRMRVEYRKAIGRQRRLNTPAWALDPTKLRAVIVRYFEMRAFGFGAGRHDMPVVGTEKQRLDRAQAKLVTAKKEKVVVLDRLCAQYVELKKAGGDPARLRKLEQCIEGLDTQICLVDRGPGVFLRMVYLYYSCGCDSVDVAGELGMKSPAIRQALWRMGRIGQELNGELVPPHRRCRAAASLRTKQRRDQRRAAGLCTLCGGEKSAQQYVLCESCRVRFRKYYKGASSTYSVPSQAAMLGESVGAQQQAHG